MPIGLLFWILMILWMFSWIGTTWGVGPPWALHASSLLLFVLLFLLGWHDFGFILQGR